ncbi:hypothetical protein [Pedobacter alpinus]|uniref:Uncharacterized protein n=1 Tax=Pedobacter alpinus TaxID=1590643 RepID=A0ABW5TT09_9SPHI
MKKQLFTLLIFIGSYTNTKAQIYTPSGSIQGSTGNDYVGVGTITPNAKLDLGTGYGANGVKFLMYNDNFSNELAGTKCGFYMDNYRPNNLNLVFPEASAYPGLFTITAKNTSGTTLNPYFSVTGLTGNVGIGTINPAYKLDVIGTIRSREVKVDMNGADFVFEKDYGLMPLSDLEKFITINKHLPQIASAKEMEANGVELGSLNSKLLQKVEELTLYLIEQKKSMDDLKAIVSQQNQEILKLKSK